MSLFNTRYLLIISTLLLFSCSNEVGPDDVVTSIEICHKCSDDRTILVVFANGQPIDAIDAIKPGDCEKWTLVAGGDNLTGSDTITIYWGYRQGDSIDSLRFSPLPLNKKEFILPCD